MDQVLLKYVNNAKVDFDKSFSLLGAGGVGKSYFMSLVKKYYDQQEDEEIMITAFTNSVCAMYLKYGIRAKTLHAGLGIDIYTDQPYMINNKITVLVVDEISMVPSPILSLLLKLKRSLGYRIICLGDWTQMDSVEEKPQAKIEERERSQLYGDICDWQQMEFTKNLRSDDTIFNLRNKIVEEKAAKPYKTMNDFIRDHQIKQDDVILRGVCKFHSTRLTQNTKFMDTWLKHKLPTLKNKATIPFTFIEKTSGRDSEKVKYKTTLTLEMPVSCEVRCGKLKLTKGDSLSISGWDDGHIYLVDLFSVQYKIKRDKFAKNFRLAFCITVNRAQGADIAEKYILFDYLGYDWRMMNVAVTRCTKHEDVKFESVTLDQLDAEDIAVIEKNLKDTRYIEGGKVRKVWTIQDFEKKFKATRGKVGYEIVYDLYMQGIWQHIGTEREVMNLEKFRQYYHDCAMDLELVFRKACADYRNEQFNLTEEELQKIREEKWLMVHKRTSLGYGAPKYFD
eukprot:Lithocolla_globosa_v1_NODE_68_length_7079_cov_24.683371.p2 type:complete len:507 gc:universal NODE_68_length_7079_cov_24.683371:2512-992(-)